MKRKNSFDFVRLIAAFGVIYSHSFALTGKPEPTIGDASIGKVCVWVFFIVSGYLISYSWKSYPRFNVYMYKRVLRIFPGLIFAIILTIIGAGLLSTLSYKDYILNQATISYANNIFLINTQYNLPGVFTSNPYPTSVNGSIWTLAYEFLMYLGVAVFGVLKLLNKKKIPLLLISLFALNILLLFLPNTIIINQGFVFYFNPLYLANFSLMFFAGVYLQVFDKKINYSLWSLSLLAFIFGCYILPSITILFGGTLLAYGIIGFCKSSLVTFTNKFGDISYGVYIYGFVVQQTIQYFYVFSNPYKLFAFSAVISAICGYLSWHLVEKRFVRYKNSINKDSYPITDRNSALERAW